ncbi:MAG: transposase-like protein [Psychroserpens sp.]|jgi:transposase-like protein
MRPISKLKGSGFTIIEWLINMALAIVDFYLSETRAEPAARAFFDKALNSSGLPSKVVIDKSGANIAALDTLNV